MLAAILHLCVIVGGPPWYRFFGAGEGMARAAERGSVTPALITLVIAFVLTIWALYAFSGSGLIRRLPLLRTGLIVISAIYLLRAAVLVPTVLLKPEMADAFPDLELSGRAHLRASLRDRDREGVASSRSRETTLG